MLDQLTYQPSSTIVKHTATVRPVNGHGRRAFKHLSKSQRAALAVAVMHASQPAAHFGCHVARSGRLDHLHRDRHETTPVAPGTPGRDRRLLKPPAPEPVKSKTTSKTWRPGERARRTDREDAAQITSPLWDKIAETSSDEPWRRCSRHGRRQNEPKRATMYKSFRFRPHCRRTV